MEETRSASPWMHSYSTLEGGCGRMMVVTLKGHQQGDWSQCQAQNDPRAVLPLQQPRQPHTKDLRPQEERTWASGLLLRGHLPGEMPAWNFCDQEGNRIV